MVLHNGASDNDIFSSITGPGCDVEAGIGGQQAALANDTDQLVKGTAFLRENFERTQSKARLRPRAKWGSRNR